MHLAELGRARGVPVAEALAAAVAKGVNLARGPRGHRVVLAAGRVHDGLGRVKGLGRRRQEDDRTAAAVSVQSASAQRPSSGAASGRRRATAE